MYQYYFYFFNYSNHVGICFLYTYTSYRLPVLGLQKKKNIISFRPINLSALITRQEMLHVFTNIVLCTAWLPKSNWPLDISGPSVRSVHFVPLSDDTIPKFPTYAVRSALGNVIMRRSRAEFRTVHWNLRANVLREAMMVYCENNFWFCIERRTKKSLLITKSRWYTSFAVGGSPVLNGTATKIRLFNVSRDRDRTKYHL